MTTTETGVMIVAVLGLVAIFAFLRYTQRAKVKITGAGNTGLELDASSDPAPAIRAEGLKSRQGGLTVEDGTGRGADVKQVEVEKDIRISANSQPPKA